MPYKTIYHNRGIEMPTYYKVTEVEGSITVELRPKNIFRRLVKGWIPYLTGDNLTLELKVTSGLGFEKQGDYHWELYDFGSDKNKRTVVSGRGKLQLKPKGVTTVELKHVILYESDYHIDVQCPQTQQHTLLSFYAMSRDVYRAKWATSLMSGFIGGILGVLIGYLLASSGNVKP
jgi:hypothetical protein